MKKLLVLYPIYLLFTGCTLSHSLAYASSESSNEIAIMILDEASLSYAPKNNLPFSEVSDLTYDEKNHQLYMIGDKGYFYTFSAQFDKKIEDLNYLSAFKIDEKSKHGTYDSEGLTHDDKGELYLSFEGTPRISSINKEGYLQKNVSLPAKLSNKQTFRNGNKIFEALAWHPKYGLLTAAEFPIRGKGDLEQSIYDMHGEKWNFQAQNHTNSAVTAIEVMDDGNLLILERAYSGITNPFVITLKKLYLDKCTKERLCQTKVLAEFNSYKGWIVNNYEGLARVGKNRYLMVSDNNNKMILSNMLIYFEVKE